MWDYVKWLLVIVAIIILFEKIKTVIRKFDSSNLRFSLSILWYYFKRMVNHPLYNKIGIGLNALQLLFGSIYALLGSLSLVLKGHSINYAMIPFILMMAVSINLFYQSTKLYQ